MFSLSLPQNVVTHNGKPDETMQPNENEISPYVPALVVTLFLNCLFMGCRQFGDQAITQLGSERLHFIWTHLPSASAAATFSELFFYVRKHFG